VRRQLCGQLSRGLRQRVGVADAILGEPPVVLLDEPTTGLDPNQLRELRRLLRELAPGRAILFSTHALAEAELLCDRVLVMFRGRIVAADKPAVLAGEGTLDAAFARLTEAAP
jgi:ABC-2 type transport system ATP-binding protein